jgi:DNA-binding Xre family transcriptional regulator
MPTGAKPQPGPLTSEIAASLRAHIARKNWKDREVADATGIPASTFSQLMSGHKQIDIEQLDRIAWALHLDIVDVIKAAEDVTHHRQASKGWTTKRLPIPDGK